MLSGLAMTIGSNGNDIPTTLEDVSRPHGENIDHVFAFMFAKSAVRRGLSGNTQARHTLNGMALMWHTFSVPFAVNNYTHYPQLGSRSCRPAIWKAEIDRRVAWLGYFVGAHELK